LVLAKLTGVPSPLYIRKQILEALQTEIIPLLQGQTCAQLMGGVPIIAKGTEPVVLQKSLLAEPTTHPLEIIADWQQSQLKAKRIARLGLLYGGATEEHLGVTRQMAALHGAVPEEALDGVTSFHLQAPAVYSIPANVPHRGMAHPFSHAAKVRIKLLMFLYNEREVFLSHTEQGQASHHLHITEPVITPLLHQYVEVARNGNQEGSQLLLLMLMQKLQQYLATNYLSISNSSWPPLEGRTITIPVQATRKNTQLCHQAISYIQFHLHAPLNLKILAEQSGVSERHLNKVFKKEIGITLMRFITQCRLESAKSMLCATDERISDIAKLVGFASSQSFDGCFRRSEKLSPSQYRKRYSKR